MTDALEDHEGTVIIGGRTLTNLRFADDIDGLAGEEEEEEEECQYVKCSAVKLRCTFMARHDLQYF